MSAEPWNEFNLPKPPVVTIPTKNSKLDLAKLRKTLDKAIVWYESQKDLDESAAVCSRLLARRNNSFRNLQGYRELRKANSALCRLLRLDIVAVIKNLAGNLPAFVKVAGMETYLPSRECYDYLLLRLIALQKLYIRITTCCLKSAAYFCKIISNNFFFDILTVFLSIIARIWKLCCDNASITARFYGDLVKHRLDFPLRMQDLCKDFLFPTALDCGEEESLKATSNRLAEYAATKKGIAIIDLSQDEAKPARIVSMKVNSPSNLHLALQPTSYSPNELDVGVAVCRDTLHSSQEGSNDLKTLESISKFIKKESHRRKTMLAECRTKNVSEKTWKIFKKKISKLPTNDNRSAVKLVKSLLGNIWLLP